MVKACRRTSRAGGGERKPRRRRIAGWCSARTASRCGRRGSISSKATSSKEPAKAAIFQYGRRGLSGRSAFPKPPSRRAQPLLGALDDMRERGRASERAVDDYNRPKSQHHRRQQAQRSIDRSGLTQQLGWPLTRDDAERDRARAEGIPKRAADPAALSEPVRRSDRQLRLAVAEAAPATRRVQSVYGSRYPGWSACARQLEDLRRQIESESHEFCRSPHESRWRRTRGPSSDLTKKKRSPRVDDATSSA